MPEFQIVSPYKMAGDQPEAVAKLVEGIRNGLTEQTLMGVTGSGKTFTMANIIEQTQRPTLVLAHNKTLAAQLCTELREFFPHNAVEYFVSYYDYYQPEAYIASTDTYIEKDSAINDEIDRLRHSATSALSERRDVIIVSSVSCIYSLGDPIDYKKMVDFQASYTTNANNTANLNSVDYTTSLEGGLAIERVACIKQGNWVAPAVETTDPEVLQKLDMLPYSVPGYSDGKYFVGVSGYWAIHSKATDAQKAAAKDFINWMFTDQEAQKIVVNDCKFIPPYDNFDGMKASDPLSQRIMDANNSGNTMNGWVYSGCPNTWSQQVAGVEVQKYLAGEADWDEVTKTCIEQWSELRKQQNN